MSIKPVFIFLVLFNVSISYADELFDTYRSVRAMGMGGAYTGIVSGIDSLFYNPASLVDVKGLNINLLNVNVAGTEFDDQILESLDGLTNSSTIGQSLNDLYGKPLSASAGARAGLTLPGFGLAGFGHANMSLTVNNPVIPDLEVNSILDTGVVIGFAKRVNRIMNFGLAIKQVSRYGDRATFTASSVSSLDPQVITDALDKKGTGYGVDAAIEFIYRGDSFIPKISAVAKNIGGIKFTNDNNQFGPPPELEQEVVLAASMIYDTSVASLLMGADYRYALNEDITDGRKLHLGMELSLPLIDLRGGLNQGYLSYGAGINLGIFRLDAASYGVEIGERTGQLEDRRNSVLISFDFGFEFNANKGSGGSGFKFKGAGRGGEVTLGSGGGRRSYKRKYYKNYNKQRR